MNDMQTEFPYESGSLRVIVVGVPPDQQPFVEEEDSASGGYTLREAEQSRSEDGE